MCLRYPAVFVLQCSEYSIFNKLLYRNETHGLTVTYESVCKYNNYTWLHFYVTLIHMGIFYEFGIHLFFHIGTRFTVI